jgi:hypothetical protein
LALIAVQQIPQSFARWELPEFNTVLYIQDEESMTWEVNYDSSHFHLYSGWRRFALDHRLKLGDKMKFWLAGPYAFKVSTLASLFH